MNVMIVTPEQLPGTSYLKIGDNNIYLRSSISGLMFVPVDLLILAEGLSEKQRTYARLRTVGVGGKIIDICVT
jgi:hypothetical protein